MVTTVSNIAKGVRSNRVCTQAHCSGQCGPRQTLCGEDSFWNPRTHMPAPIYFTKPLITTCTNGLSKNRRDEGTTTGQNGASIPQLAAISSYVVCLRFCIHIKSVCVCVCVRVCVPIALLFLVKLNVHIYSANLKYDKIWNSRW